MYQVQKMWPYSVFKNRPDNFMLDNITNTWNREITLAGHPFTFLRCSI